MAQFKIRIPNNNATKVASNMRVPIVPSNVAQSIQNVTPYDEVEPAQNQVKPQPYHFNNQQNQIRTSPLRDMDSKAISAVIAAAKSSNELTGRLTNMIMQSLDVQKFRERVLEEALKDPELRIRIILELIRRL
jgi:hypothetical protein